MVKERRNVKTGVMVLAVFLATSLSTQSMAAWEDRSDELPGLKSTSDVLTPVLIVTGVVLVALLIKKAKKRDGQVALFKSRMTNPLLRREPIHNENMNTMWHGHVVIEHYSVPKMVWTMRDNNGYEKVRARNCYMNCKYKYSLGYLRYSSGYMRAGFAVENGLPGE